MTGRQTDALPWTVLAGTATIKKWRSSHHSVLIIRFKILSKPAAIHTRFEDAGSSMFCHRLASYRSRLLVS